ncbi:unnamed protein product [Onchocerca ochengi]|uniref:YKR017Cp-like protein n=1 Tax=Onchocerca ochengi TaxID=42157 RepID=A0A182EQV6_ONCOC|nr:unnamed protein product [Onchocerca ochengi]
MPSSLNFSVENLISNHHHHNNHQQYYRNHHHHQQQQQREEVYSSKPSSSQTSDADIILRPKILSPHKDGISSIFTATLNKLPPIRIQPSTFHRNFSDVKSTVEYHDHEHLADLSDENSTECIPGTSREFFVPNIIANQSCKSDYRNVTSNNINNNNSTSSTSCHPIVCLSAPIPQTLSYFDVLLPHVQYSTK